MIVKILGYKISLEIVILMLVIYLVMMVHALASCCNGSAIAEGFAAPDPMTRTNPRDIRNMAKLAEEKLRRDAENIMRTKRQEDEAALNEASKRIQEEARIQLEKLRREEEARIQSEKIKRAIELERSHKRGKTRF
jgi:hypothetical protein